MGRMREFASYLMPYTRKAKAAFVGFFLSAAIAFLQDDGLTGWVGTLPRPWNSILLAGIPVLALWLIRERGNYGDGGGFGEPGAGV